MANNFIGIRHTSNKKALEKLTKQKSLSTLLGDLQKVFNEFIRTRDTQYSNGQAFFTCIACGKPKDLSEMHAGHFFSVGAHPAVRFDEDNCHGECRACNYFQHGNLLKYKENLIKKIGASRFQSLEIRSQNRSKLVAWEVNMLIDFYKKSIEQLKKKKTIIPHGNINQNQLSNQKPLDR